MRSLVEGLHRVPARPHDRNHYLEGWLPSIDPDRPHGVVLALLPQDGTGNASSVCTDLLRSYPALGCVVMCGIAGGVPSLAEPGRHVRLGDVVVADAIVGYGHVRRVDGVELLRRPQDGISADLTRAMHELRIGELAAERPWRAWLGGADPRLAQFRRPPAGADVLCVAGAPVAHPDPSATGHEPGWPKVHYGPIGSADVLLRDESKRDELAARYNILAVEMEASGIVSAAVLRNRTWFVVRGVVDYCSNTDRTDEWYLYSSLAAAAYVRALLAMCHPFGEIQTDGVAPSIQAQSGALASVPAVSTPNSGPPRPSAPRSGPVSTAPRQPPTSAQRSRPAVRVLSVFTVLLTLVAVYIKIQYGWPHFGGQPAATDRITRAVEQLAAGDIIVRTAAVGALEQIMRDSPADQPTIVDILARFVRTHAPRAGVTAGACSSPLRTGGPAPKAHPTDKRPDDIQAALTVLGRRNIAHDRRGDPINLANTDLRNANLGSAKLPSANLCDADARYANLTDADLSGVRIRGANLLGADLTRADFTNATMNWITLYGAHLIDADLANAVLDDACLYKADLGGANLSGASLADANLTDANLASSRGLTSEQLRHARISANTKLPIGIARPEPRATADGSCS